MAVLILSILFVFQLAACGKTPTPDDDKEQTTYFTIRFNTNGGTSVKSIKIKKGEAITLPDSPTKEGYIFDGWYLDSSCVEALEEGYLVKKSITLYAKWKEATKPVEDYQVIFYVDGEVYFQATLKSGAVLTLPKTPTKKGYVFDGWYFDSDFLQAVNDNYVIIGNVSIYAKWKTAQASEECEHEPIADKGYSPTCTKQGLSDGTHCDKCGKVLVEQEEIPAIGHSLERHEAKAATCTEIGWEAYDTCKRDGCEYTTYAEIPALNHDIEHHEAKAATCTEIGWDAYDTCKRDGCEYTTYAEIPPHSFDKNGVCSVCGYSETGLTFTLNKDGKSYSISGIGTFTGTDLVIPKANFDTKPVTSIGNYAFSGCSGLTNITIPDSVTSIGNGAFYGCTGLTSVTIGNSVTSIGIYAFYGCSGLTSMILPFVGASKTASDGYDQVFGYIFGYTTTGSSSSSVSGATYQYYGGKYYYYYIPSSLKSVTITGGEIPSCAFYNCSGLTSVTIGNGVTSIGSKAFYNCSGLTSIIIPDSVTSIGDGAFSNTAWYNNKRAGLVYAGKVAYTYKGAMPDNTSIVIEDGTLGIADCAFTHKGGLTSITIPDSVTSIGVGAFNGCDDLTSMTLPFVGASKTASDGYDQVFGYIFGYTWHKDSSSSVSGETYQYYGGNSRYYYYYIPSSIKSVTITGGEIPSCAFYNCSGLTSVAIPDGVTSIGGEAFKNCSGLTSITIPDSVTSIGVAAFRNCSGLTSITIPDSETSIGGSAFEDCSGLTSIIIPNSVTSIGNFAFWNCSGLTTVFYAGTEEQWKAVSIGFNNSSLTNATIVYSSDGAERTYSFVTNCDQSVDSVNATHLASLPTLTKDGYHFCGWYDNEAFEGKAVSALYCSKEKTTLYAKWLTEEEWNALKDGTTFAKAYVAESGQTYDVTITTGGQIVYFAFTPTTSGSFTIQSTGSGQRIVNTLYSSTKSFLSNINDGDGKNFKLTYTMTAGTTYYIAVKFYGSSTTGTFKVSFS